MKKISLFLLTLPLSTLATVAPFSIAVAQQVTSDGTVSTTVTTRDGKNFNINDGTRRGGNLFHSFKEFSVPTGGSANFNNPTDIQNIIGRVTGGSVSNIDGLIRTLGKANLFLLNPAGIIFGPNAQLNIGGSFLGSTANSLLFKDGFEFSATDLQPQPLLTITAPIGLGFRNNPQNIRTESTTTQYPTLEVAPGKTLALIGGNVSLDRPDVLAPGGRVELGGLSTAGIVGLNTDGSLSFPVGVPRGDVSLTNEAFVDVRAGEGGSIAVHARNLDISGGSFLRAGIKSGLGTPSAQAGDIKVDAKETVSLDGSSITNRVEEKGVGNAGGIELTTNSLTVSNGSEISASTFNKGDAGIVQINASDTISLQGEGKDGGNSQISSKVVEGAIGKAGGIELTTKNLSLTDGAQISASTFGQGNAGSVTINATGTIKLDGEDKDGNNSGIFSRVNQKAEGNAGGIQLTTNFLTMTNGAEISASTLNKGDAGIVRINASDTVSLDGKGKDEGNTQISSKVNQGAVGNSSGIELTTTNLSLTNGAQISASTYGKGDAGSVIINATGTISAASDVKNGFKSGIFSVVESSGVGDAGGIQINTNNLFLTDGAQINANTLGKGNSGRIVINATGTISADGENKNGNNAGIFSNVESSYEGNAGGIEIKTNNLSLTNGGIINAGTYGKGNAGSVKINATGTISADGEGKDGFNSGIYSRVSQQKAEGDAGGIEIKTNNLYLINGGRINASTLGKGDAGSIIINASGTIKADGEDKAGSDSGIFSTVSSSGVGNAGGIKINTNNLSVTNGGIINASTFGKGNAGSVIINATGTIKADGDGKDKFHSGIFSNVESSGIGNAGGIEINTNNLSLTNGGLISASTSGTGKAGIVIINATDTIKADGEATNKFNSGIYSRVSRRQAQGNAGGIRIKTNNLSLTNGAQVNTSSLGKGNAGSVIINATGTISADGKDNNGDNSGVFSTVQSSGVGNAGGINITARSLSLTNGGILSSTNFSDGGSAGNITVTTAKDIRLDNKAFIEANTNGGEGNISLNARDLILRRNSNITTNATGTADGGNITINTGNLVALENSKITADAQRGYGGNVIITTTGGRFLSPDSVISATSEAGPQFSGTVQFKTPDIDPSKGLFELTETVIDPAQQIAQNPCTKGFGSTFTIVGRGGLPTDPNKIISSDNVRVDLIQPVTRTVNSTSTTYKQRSQQLPVKKIVPVQGWIYNEKGQVVLVGYDPTKVGVQREQPAPNSSCAAVK